MARQDPLGNFRFRLEIDGLQAAAFSEAAIGATTTDVIHYREGTDPNHLRKLPGLTRFGNVTLKRGITTSHELYDWYRQVVTGQAGFRRNVSLVIQDQSGADVVRFQIADAWPMKYESSDLKANGNEVAIETLELANEGLERVQ